MPEESTTPAEGQQTESTETNFTPPASQDELNKLIGERVKREQAKFSDYKDLQAKAAKLDEIEKANQTESERLTGERDAAVKERDSAVLQLARLEVALSKGLTVSQAKRLVGDTREELEADADQLLRDLGEAGKPRPPKPDPNQGGTGSHSASTADQFAGAVGGLFTT